MAINGFTGKVLRVDLTAGKTSIEELNWEWAEKFIGGRGLAARYAWDEIKPKTDPLGPENVLMIWTGPAEGTMIPLNGRYLFATKSPKTGTYLDCYVGGHFGPELKYAGFDGVIIKGKASKPVYLFIKNGKAEIKDASKLWGKRVDETQKAIREENGDKKIRVACIGPAGENLSKMACICSDLWRQAGRGGIGAVMGSKNLKAVAVRGTMGLSVSGISKLVEVCKESYKVDGIDNPENAGMITDGTPILVDMSSNAGILPTRNFQSGVYEDVEKINTETLKKTTLVRRRACFGCVLACSSFSKVRKGKFKGACVEGPEYETIALCGSNCGISDFNAIVKFNQECDMLGLDTMSTGDTVAWAMEAYEKGILTKNDTDGLDLRFGNVDAYVQLPEIIATRKGRLGSIIADGVAVAAAKVGKGSEKFAMHVKGLEVPAYDPRGTIGMALTYATSERGADHLRAWPAAVEAYGNVDPWTTEGKAELVAEDQRRTAVKWSIMFCDLFSIGYPPMVKLYNALTGKNVDEAYLRHVGDRIWNLVRAFNIREGFSAKDDVQPWRIENEELPSGRTKGKRIPREDFEKLLKEYYKLWNWDEQGRPTKECLHAVELDDIAKQLDYLKKN